NQQDDTYLRIEAVFQIKECECRHCTEDRYSKRKNDRQWEHPAFVLCHQEEVGEDESQGENNDFLSTRLLLLQRHARPFIAIAVRQHLRRNALDSSHGSPGTFPRRGLTVDLDRREKVVARDDVGSQNRGGR